MEIIAGLDWWLAEEDEPDSEAEEEAWTRADEEYERDLDEMFEARDGRRR
jgi:hypothetical protein